VLGSKLWYALKQNRGIPKETCKNAIAAGLLHHFDDHSFCNPCGAISLAMLKKKEEQGEEKLRNKIKHKPLYNAIRMNLQSFSD